MRTAGLVAITFRLSEEACSPLKMRIRVGADIWVSEPLGAGESLQHTFVPPGGPTTYPLVLQGEGIKGGCNTGTLNSWGGKLWITTRNAG